MKHIYWAVDGDNSSLLQPTGWSMQSIVHVISTVCLSGLEMGLVWAVGLAMGYGLRPIFGAAKSRTKVGHVSDICPKFV